MISNDIKVLHINCNYIGTKLHQTMVEHLEPYVKENIVFCPIYSGSPIVTTPNENVIVSNCFTLLDRAFFYRKQKKIMVSIEEKIEVQKYNCIHAYTLFTDGNVAYQLSKKYGMPYVVAIRSTDVMFFEYRRNLKNRGAEILENASAIFFLSETTMDKVYNTYVPKSIVDRIKKKSYIIPNGIDDFWLSNVYEHRSLSDVSNKFVNKEVRLVCVAQIIKRKNIPAIQNAMRLLEKEGWNVSLNLIGKAVNEKLLNKLKKNSQTSYYPPVQKEELLNYYRSADIFVLPSKNETFGLVYAEAMTQGLPVIYTKGEGFDGQFEDGTVGFSVSADKPEQIKDKIVFIMREYEKYSQNSTQLIDKFSWKKICANYISIYEKVARGE